MTTTWTRIIALTLFAALVLAVPLAAQDNAKQGRSHQYHHYQLVDVGTFGGPQSWQFSLGAGRTGLLNSQGTMVGSADTLGVDPYCLDSPDCHAAHAFRWQESTKIDLGVLSGGVGSQVNWISPNGLMVGVSDNGQQDPLDPALPQIHAVLWGNGEMTDLGTLPGGYNSWANAINSRGEIAGQAYNSIPDPNSWFGYGYQSRAFYWKNGTMQDLGTLGNGTQAVGGLINERGQVVGWSYTSSIANATCAGISTFTLTTGSFIWDTKNGMKDIGGLGGTCTLANDLNNHGQVVGGSALTGDTNVHPFVWNAATGVSDLLDPSDSSYGFAEGENAHGDVAGGTCDAVTCYAVLWRKSGGRWQKTNLSTINDGAFSISINSSEQVVGNWFGVGAFLSEHGGRMVDLGTLVPPGSGLQFYEVEQINDLGEISVQGSDAGGNNHAILLIPCDENHPDVKGCDYDTIDAETAAARFGPTPVIQRPATLSSRGRTPAMFNRFRSPGVRLTPVPGTPMPDAGQTLPDTATDYLQADHSIGPARGRRGYCTANSSGLTGGCVGYSYANFCSVKRSTACPVGLKAIKPGYYQCALMQKDYVDLGRSCSY